MKKDAKTMKEVAERCTQYNPTGSKDCHCSKNSTSSEAISCQNCTHYTPDIVCDIHLYDEITKNHDL